MIFSRRKNISRKKLTKSCFCQKNILRLLICLCSNFFFPCASHTKKNSFKGFNLFVRSTLLSSYAQTTLSLDELIFCYWRWKSSVKSARNTQAVRKLAILLASSHLFWCHMQLTCCTWSSRRIYLQNLGIRYNTRFSCSFTCVLL